MTRMKRILALILASFSLLAAFPALADVMWEPRNNFYENHRDECTYENRAYFANGKDGYALVYDSPASKSPAAAILNGTELHIYFTFAQGGTTWGVAEYALDESGYAANEFNSNLTGWVPMADMHVRYDSQAFLAEHEVVPVTEEPRDFEGEGSLIFWTYPNSGEVYATVELPCDDISIASLYTDADGREWGNIGYYRGMRNCWLCLSDPTNPDIPEIAVEYKNLYPAAAPEKLPSGSNSIVWIVVLVVVVVAGTAVLLRLQKNKNKVSRVK